MGKYLNALKIADGTGLSRAVLQMLDEPAGRGPALAPPQDHTVDRPAIETVVKKPSRPLSLMFSDAAPLLSPGREDRHAAEQYRVVRTKIFQNLPTPSVTVISSPGIGDGKTVSAVNLTAMLALRTEEKVLLIDGDMRLSSVHTRLGIVRSPGLADVLAGTATLEEAAFRVNEYPNFYILTAGELETNPTELLDSKKWRNLMAQVRQDFGRTIIDSPPVEAVSDYDLIAAQCDNLILVVRPDHTDRNLLHEALAKVRGKLAGVLINGAEDWLLWKYRSAGYYYQTGGTLRKKGK